MSDESSTHLIPALRAEIVESEKTQADFLKWKLIAVGAVASISLGFSSVPAAGTKNNGNGIGSQVLLCAVPLICAYVDLMCLHLMMRIRTIGSFLKKEGDKYEVFVSSLRTSGVNPFIYETAALHGTSIVFNLVLMLLALLLPWDPRVRIAYCIAGEIGVVFTLGVQRSYPCLAQKVDARADELVSAQETVGHEELR